MSKIDFTSKSFFNNPPTVDSQQQDSKLEEEAKGQPQLISHDSSGIKRRLYQRESLNNS